MRPRLRLRQVDRAPLTPALAFAVPGDLSGELCLFLVADLIEPSEWQSQFFARRFALSAVSQNRQARETEDFGIALGVADVRRIGAVRRAAIRLHRAPPAPGC